MIAQQIPAAEVQLLKCGPGMEAVDMEAVKRLSMVSGCFRRCKPGLIREIHDLGYGDLDYRTAYLAALICCCTGVFVTLV
jgi:hypothetical protein